MINHTKSQAFAAATKMGAELVEFFGHGMTMEVGDKGDRFVVILGKARVEQIPDFPYVSEAPNDS